MCVTLTKHLMICKRLKTFYVPGNGVVIHLPGLFEEAEKNLQKGKGNVSSINTCIQIEFEINVGIIWHIDCRITGMGGKIEDF